MYGIVRNEDLEEKRFPAFDGRTKRYICHWMFAYVAFYFIYAQFFSLCVLPWRSPFLLIFTRWCIIIAILRVLHICNHYQSTRMTVSFDTITGITHVYGLATLRADHRQPTDTIAAQYIALTRIRGEEAQSWFSWYLTERPTKHDLWKYGRKSNHCLLFIILVFVLRDSRITTAYFRDNVNRLLRPFTVNLKFRAIDKKVFENLCESYKKRRYRNVNNIL